MPGTRKPAAKKAAPRKTPTPPPETEVESVPGAFDLLDALGTEEQEPVPVTLLGVNANVRRTFTAAEDLMFTEFLRRNRFPEALKILVGDVDAIPLALKIDELSVEQGIKVLNKLAQISTLVEGEALALLPTSARRMVGAPAIPSSDGSTT